MVANISPAKPERAEGLACNDARLSLGSFVRYPITTMILYDREYPRNAHNSLEAQLYLGF